MARCTIPILHCSIAALKATVEKHAKRKAWFVLRWNATLAAEAPLTLRYEAAPDCALAPDSLSKAGRAQNHQSQSDHGKR